VKHHFARAETCFSGWRHAGKAGLSKHRTTLEPGAERSPSGERSLSKDSLTKVPLTRNPLTKISLSKISLT
jgi:hypothetical protein